jgi:hypothetical protein
MKRMTVVATSVAALLFLLTLDVSRASAETITFQLTSDHCNGAGGCLGGASSAGTVTIKDVSAGVVSVDVTLNAGFKFVSTGMETDFGFNLAGGPTITESALTTGWTPENIVNNTESALLGNNGFHDDGTGFFEYGETCTICGNGASNAQPGPFDFTITASGLTTASFIRNAPVGGAAQGQFFVVDLIGNGGNTGPVDASFAVVPDGGMTLMLLGGVLVGLETLRRRFCV